MSVLSIKRQMNPQSSVINNYTGISVDDKTDVSEKETAALMLYDNGIIRSFNHAGGELFG